MTEKEILLTEWKEEQRKPFFCHWSNYQTLIRKFKNASDIGDVERMEELKKEIHDMATLCGAYPMPELMKILEDTHLNDNDVTYIRNCIPFIERCIDSESFEAIETTVNDVNWLVGCNPEKCNCQHNKPTLLTMRGFDVIELVQEGDESFAKFPESEPPEPPPDLPNPLHQEIERMLKEQERNLNFEEQHRKAVFPEFCSNECQHVQCPYRRAENFGKPCLQRINEPNERSPKGE